MKDAILKEVQSAITAANKLKTEKAVDFMQKASEMIIECFNNKGKLIIAGNGGSICDAMHFAEEFTGYFRSRQRKPLPAIALSEPGHLTCVSNDAGYDFVFSRAVEAYMKKEDLFISLTTSGNSKNLINAVQSAKKAGGKTISFLGKTGGDMKNMCDLEWIVDGFETSDRIQEAHMASIHVIIAMVEQSLEAKRLLGELKEKKTALV